MENEMKKIIKTYLIDLEDFTIFNLILSKIITNQKIEKENLKKVLSIIKEEDFKNSLSCLQNRNLSIFVSNIENEIQNLEKKYFFKYYSMSTMINNFKSYLKNNSEIKNIILISAFSSGVNEINHKENHII
jgi:hypothetical protein